jgi:hypothetical protein
MHVSHTAITYVAGGLFFHYIKKTPLNRTINIPKAVDVACRFHNNSIYPMVFYFFIECHITFLMIVEFDDIFLLIIIIYFLKTYLDLPIMASPIFTFQDKQRKNRYFFLLDTVTGLSITVPMDLMTFLQYLGIDNKGKVSVLYSVYPHLLETGTSLEDTSFNSSSSPKCIKQLCYEYSELDFDTPNKQEKEVIHQLETLFASDLPFFEFYAAYQQLISRLSNTTKRPSNYYLSWRRTKDIFDIFDCMSLTFQDVFFDLAPKNGVNPGDLNVNLNDVYSCLEERVFTRFPDLVAACFVELGRNNLIPLDAIPHVLRNDKAIQELFIQLGMEAYLPNAAIDYNLYDRSEPLCEEVDDIRYLRQYLNLYTFYADCKPLKGIDILSLSKSELKDLLQENDCYNTQIVNFKNSNGNYLLPMMYASDYVINPQNRFLLLATFGYQLYHIVTKQGKVIDDTGYYDFYFVNENTAYLQNAVGLRWMRWFYDVATQDIVKHDVAINYSYEEGVWEQEERRFQQSVIEIDLANQHDTFEILELEFGKEDDMYSIYLTMLNTPTKETVRDVLKNALIRLQNRGVNLLDRYKAAFELYKELLLHYNGQIWFSTPSLNYFVLYDGLTEELKTGFGKHYQNDDFSKEIQCEKLLYRPINAHFSLKLFQYRGHYTLSYKFHFQMHAAAEVFQQDCEDFINTKPFTAEGDLEAYANEFLSYLLGRNYKQVNAYRQYVGRDSISEILGVELTAESQSDTSEQSSHENGGNHQYDIDDNDMPF